jgi:hypothetical protein
MVKEVKRSVLWDRTAQGRERVGKETKERGRMREEYNVRGSVTVGWRTESGLDEPAEVGRVFVYKVVDLQEGRKSERPRRLG